MELILPYVTLPRMSSSPPPNLQKILRTLNATAQAAEAERSVLREEAASLRKEVQYLRAQLAKRDAEAAAACDSILSAVRILSPSDHGLLEKDSNDQYTLSTPSNIVPSTAAKRSVPSELMRTSSGNPFLKSSDLTATPVGARSRACLSPSKMMVSIPNTHNEALKELEAGRAHRKSHMAYTFSGSKIEQCTSISKAIPSFQFGSHTSVPASIASSVFANSSEQHSSSEVFAPFQFGAFTFGTAPAFASVEKQSPKVSFVAGQTPNFARRRSLPSLRSGVSLNASGTSSIGAASNAAPRDEHSLVGARAVSNSEARSPKNQDDSCIKDTCAKLPIPKSKSPDFDNIGRNVCISSVRAPGEFKVAKGATAAEVTMTPSSPALRSTTSSTLTTVTSSTVSKSRKIYLENAGAPRHGGFATSRPTGLDLPEQSSASARSASNEEVTASNVKSVERENTTPRVSESISAEVDASKKALSDVLEQRDFGKGDNVTVARGRSRLHDRNTTASRESAGTPDRATTSKAFIDSTVDQRRMVLPSGASLTNVGKLRSAEESTGTRDVLETHGVWNREKQAGSIFAGESMEAASC